MGWGTALYDNAAPERHCDRRLVRAQSSAAAIGRVLNSPEAAAVVDDAPVAHPHEPLGGIGHRLVVGDQQDRLAAGVQAGEEFEHFLAAFRVERAGRFVRQQQRRLVGECPGDRQALTLTTRQRGRRLLGLVADAQQIQQIASRVFPPPCACGRR